MPASSPARTSGTFLDVARKIRHLVVSVIDHDGAPHGWRFCQDLTSTLHHHRPNTLVG